AHRDQPPPRPPSGIPRRGLRPAAGHGRRGTGLLRPEAVARLRPHLLALAAAVCLAWPGERAAAATPEAQVKAAYLYKLASFVRWPPAAMRQGPFRMCVAGRSDVARVLAELARGQRVESLPIEVRTLQASQAHLARDCHVLFLGRGPATA